MKTKQHTHTEKADTYIMTVNRIYLNMQLIIMIIFYYDFFYFRYIG